MKYWGRFVFALSVLGMPAIAAAFSSPAAAQNLVLNPSFESVFSNAPVGSGSCQATSWTSNGTCGENYEYQVFAHSGSHSLVVGAFFPGAAGASQSISGLQAGRYDFSFFYQVFSPAAGNFTASVGTNTFSLSTATATAYIQFEQVVRLAAGNTVVAFSNGAPGSGLTSIDDVSLIYLGPNINALTPQLPTGAPRNAVNVAGAIDIFLGAGGTLAGGFSPLNNLSGQQLANALVQLDGEASTGAERGAFQLMNQFLGLMLDPFVDGRFGAGASSFAPEREALPSDIAMAYAKVLKAPAKPPQDNPWTVWGTGFGGSSHTSGDATVGSSNVTANTYGFASGAAYHFTRETLLGFALAG